MNTCLSSRAWLRQAVIQLDGHGAERLAMKFSGLNGAITQAPALAASSRNDRIRRHARFAQTLIGFYQTAPGSTGEAHFLISERRR
jgi:hypothetical protein